jgi:hypothetical protein
MSRMTTLLLGVAALKFQRKLALNSGRKASCA